MFMGECHGQKTGTTHYHKSLGISLKKIRWQNRKIFQIDPQQRRYRRKCKAFVSEGGSESVTSI